MTTDEWVAKYCPSQNPFTSDGPYDNTLIDYCTQKERDYLQKFSINQIWTLVSGDDENFYIIPGFHIVNREGFFITNIPYQNSDINSLEVNDNEMLTVLDACEHCFKFALSIDVPLSGNVISDYYQQYKSNHTPGFVTIGEAKYRCVDLIEQYKEDNFEKENNLSDTEYDKLHDYFSQL